MTRVWAFNSFDIEMTEEQALSVPRVGSCDAAIEKLLKAENIRKQLDKISDEKLVAALSWSGAWMLHELLNRNDNEARIIWLAALDIAEELDMEG